MPEEPLRTVQHQGHYHHHDRTTDSADPISRGQDNCRINSEEDNNRIQPLVTDDQQAATPSMMIMCPSLQNVIVLQVGGESPDFKESLCPNEVSVGDLPATDDGPDKMQCLRPMSEGDGGSSDSTSVAVASPMATPEDLPDTLYLSDLEFSNAYNLFKVRSRAITGRLIDLENGLQNMKSQNYSRLGHRGLLLLDGSLVNLKELQLTGLTIGDETLDMIGCRFPRLTKLTVSNCKTPDQQHMVALESHYGLEELIVQDVNLADGNFRRILPSLSKLRVLKLIYCNVGNETLAAIIATACLPHLTSLTVTPSNGEEITDEGLETLAECRPQMTEMCLECVQLTDASVQKIVRCMPNLSKLKISSANIGDETVTLLAALNQLKVLELRGTHATDDGLADVVRQLGRQLEELHLESGSITESGLLNAIPQLAPTIRYFTVDISESTKRVDIQGTGSSPASLQMTVKDGDLVRAIVQKFPGVDTLTISSQSLSAALLQDLAQFQTNLTGLFLTGSSIDDAAAMAVLQCFARLRRLSLYESIVTGSVLCDVVHGMLELQELNVENKEFLTSETIVKMIPRLKRMPSYQLYDNREQQNGQLMVSTNEGLTELRLSGPSINDQVLIELFNQYEKVERLRLRETSVTNEGIIRSASSSSTNLDAIKELSLISDGIGDETLKCFGTSLPNLVELTLKSTKVTDDGLDSLNDQLVGSLETLDVSESSITDVGIRRLVTRMKSIRSLSVFDNPSVNEGIRDFLHDLFPEMGFVVPPVQESDAESSERVLVE